MPKKADGAAWEAAALLHALPPMRLLRLTALIQGVVYVTTGLWPIVSIRTFEAVTGPKTDDWLVQTVGALAAVIGLVLLLAWRRRSFPPEVLTLGVGAALAFCLVDVVFTAAGRIPPIYLADAILEAMIAGAWLAGRRAALKAAPEEAPR